MINYLELLQSPIIPSQIGTLIQKTAHNIAPVLIQGEQGTGKELIAKIIHYVGDLKYYRFYKIDCKILTEDMFNEKLAHLFKEINYGEIPATLYLKEVGHLGQNSQLKFLELIEDGLLQNGNEKKIIKNIRFISSTSANLGEKIAQGIFSEDLYYQLSIFSISVPPLRDRSKEISSIAQYILKEYSKKMKIKKVDISNSALMLLESYWWPENLRELEHVIIRSAIFSEGDELIEKDLLFKTETENSSFSSFLKKNEMKTPSPKEKRFLNGQNVHSPSVFFIELVHRIKNPLVSIKTFTQLFREKFNDVEFREQFYRVVTEDIEKIDSLLNSLLNYIKIVTPIEKTNTIHLVLEDILKKHEVQLKDKRIRIFKKYGQDLPETIIHEEQLRYIFGSLLQYIISFIPTNGSIGFLTKLSNTHKETGSNRTQPKEEGGYIEIMIIFTGYRNPSEKFKNVLGIPALQQEDVVELELRLIKEIIQKNQGMMKFEFNEKKPRTLISLKFPIERRKVFYYPSTNV